MADANKEAETYKLLVIYPGARSLIPLLEKLPHEVMSPEIPEHTADLDSGCETLRQIIEENCFDILICSSRGGHYGNALLDKGYWTGPVLMKSAMLTNAVCAHGKPVFIIHGELDGINPIARVQNEAHKFKETVRLHVLPGEAHSTPSLKTEEGWEDRLDDLIRQAVAWGKECPERGPYKNKSLNAMLINKFKLPKKVG